jgi:hypothetical protein
MLLIIAINLLINMYIYTSPVLKKTNFSSRRRNICFFLRTGYDF